MAVSNDGEVVIAHSSDIHVDDGYTARAHGGDGTRGLRCVLATARERGADVVLLAGDVFEHNRLPETLLGEAARLMEAAGLPIVILPGNHDPLVAGCAYERGGIDLLANVEVLGMDDVAAVFTYLDLEIWGRPHRDYGDMAPLAAPRQRSTRWQIAMAHGHYRSVDEVGGVHRPSWLISDSEIGATAADYVALGHWNRAVRVGDGTIPAYYSGSPDLARTVNLVRLGAGGGVAVERANIVWD